MAVAEKKTEQPTAVDTIMKSIGDIKATQKAQGDKIEELSKPIRKGLGDVFGIREGEDPLTSRGYSYLKLFGAMGGAIPWTEAKVERDLHEKLQRCYVKDGPYK